MMRKQINIVIVLLLLGVTLAACAGIRSSDESSPTPTVSLPPAAIPQATVTPELSLEGEVWRLVSYVDRKGNQMSLLPDTRITIEFADGQVSGSAGCNSYFASYQQDGENLSYSNAGMTEMFCSTPEGVMDQETEYLTALQRVSSFSIVGGRLQLFDDQGQTVLTFTPEGSGSLAGTVWQLQSYATANGSKGVLPGSEVTANFAPGGLLSGAAGCNQYSTQYHDAGGQFQVEPIAVTQKYCPQPEGLMEQESAYLSALESAVRFQIDGDQLEMYAENDQLLLSYTIILEAIEGDSLSPSNALSQQALMNMTYLIDWTSSGTAALRNGEYREPAAPGSAAEIVVKLGEHIAYGPLEDETPAAAVILVTDTGGSGVFFDLALVEELNGEPVNTTTIFLGDRVKINAVKMDGGAVLVDMVTQGPEDPFCCPTQQVLQRYVLESGGLKLESTTSRGDQDISSDIIGTQWEWVEFQEMNDELLLVDQPQNYTLSFEPDGSVQIQADCNQVLGQYSQNGSQINIELGPSTMAACPPGSLSDEYLRLLSDVVSYVTEDGNLYLAIMYDSGIMKFIPGGTP